MYSSCANEFTHLDLTCFLKEENDHECKKDPFVEPGLRHGPRPAGRLRRQRFFRGCFFTQLTSTASAADSTSTAATADAAGKVYYLNFKPEQDEAWQNLAKKYTEETGVPVTVVTAASGQYETTLMSEMAKSDAPTLFQVNGPVGLANWKDYCYDLSGTKIAGDLTSDTYALKDGDADAGHRLRYRELRPDHQ